MYKISNSGCSPIALIHQLSGIKTQNLQKKLLQIFITFNMTFFFKSTCGVIEFVQYYVSEYFCVQSLDMLLHSSLKEQIWQL